MFSPVSWSLTTDAVRPAAEADLPRVGVGVGVRVRVRARARFRVRVSIRPAAEADLLSV